MYLFSEVFDLKPTRTHRISRVSAGRLRVVPKGHWKLAGGANHRFFVNIESEPRPGRRKSRDAIPSPLRGSAHLVVVTGGLHRRLISATPPASVIEAVRRFWPEKPGTFVQVFYLYKTVSAEDFAKQIPEYPSS
jgi:hypothetical protein